MRMIEDVLAFLAGNITEIRTECVERNARRLESIQEYYHNAGGIQVCEACLELIAMVRAKLNGEEE